MIKYGCIFFFIFRKLIITIRDRAFLFTSLEINFLGWKKLEMLQK